MGEKREFKGQIGLRCDDALTDTLNQIKARHNIEPIDLTRGLLRSACQFYREHGWFSFPVVIEPEAFQAKYVAEAKAAYEGKPPKKSAGHGGAAKG